jgi:solute carrier family 25 uncoupling protein 27
MVNPHLYPSLSNAVWSISRNEGWRGLYKGLVPSTLRGAFIAVGELATYDHSKTVVKKYVAIKEGFYLHTICSLITGLVATTVAAPFDLLKTRYKTANSFCTLVIFFCISFVEQ